MAINLGQRRPVAGAGSWGRLVIKRPVHRSRNLWGGARVGAAEDSLLRLKNGVSLGTVLTSRRLSPRRLLRREVPSLRGV
jgi:hypothetical protein